MGLLDPTDPNAAMLQNIAFGLLSAGGPSRTPIGLGQAMGQAGQMGMEGYKDATQLQMQQLQMQQLLRRSQIINQAMASENAQPNTPATGDMTGGQSGGGPSAQSPTSDWSDNRIRMYAMSGDPGLMKAAELAQTAKLSKQTDITKLMDNAGINDPALRAQILQSAIAKANNLPPTRLGEGAYYDPQSSSVQGLPSQAPPGYINKNVGGNWQTVPVSGGLQGAADSAGAIEGAKEKNKIINTTVDGKTVPVMAGSVLPKSPTPQSPADAPTFNLPGLDQRQILAQGAAITDPAERQKFFDSARSASPQQFNPDDKWATIPKLAQPTGVGMTPYQEISQKNAADAAAKLSAEYGASAQQANQRMAINNQSLALVDKSTTGPGAANLNNVKSFLTQRVGIPEAVIDKAVSGDISATTELQKNLVQAATAKAKQQFGARITQSEVQLMLTRGSPSVDMTKEAIKYLLQTDNAGANYSIQQASDLGKYIQAGGDPNQFEGWYSKAFPMTNAIAGAHDQSGQAGAQPAVRKYNPATGKIE